MTWWWFFYQFFGGASPVVGVSLKPPLTTRSLAGGPTQTSATGPTTTKVS